MPEIYNAADTKHDSTEYSDVMKQYHVSKRSLGSFMVRPPRVHLGIQETNEKILLLLRRHFITNFRWILVVIILMIAPLLLMFLPWLDFMPQRFVTATVALWYLLTLGIGLNGFLSWYYNVFIVTDERIVDVDFYNLVYKNISTAKIDRIEDVTVEMGGTIRSILNFGTVFIQTAAEKNEFDFEDVPHPQDVAKLINELILKEEKEPWKRGAGL